MEAPATVEDDPLLLPWDAVDSVRSKDYLRKSRYFLEFAGYVDPALIHH